MSTDLLLSKSATLLSVAEYQAAVPYLKEYLKKMDGLDDSRVKAMVQDVRFKLGLIYVTLKDPNSAAIYLKDYTSGLPLYKRRQAMKLLAVSLYESGDYPGSISTVTNAFIDPPQIDVEEEKEVSIDDLSEEQLGGMSKREIKRYKKLADKAGETFDFSFDSGKPKPEPEYSLEDRVVLYMTMGQSCSELGTAELEMGIKPSRFWELSVEPYEFVIEHSTDEERRGYAIMQLVTSLVELERFEEVRSLVTELYRTNARYDIRVNMALMTAGNALLKAEEYDSALQIYRMVLPRKVLLDYQVEKMNVIRTEEGMPYVEVITVTNDIGQVQTTFGNKKSGLVSEKIVLTETQAIDLRPKPPELLKLENSAGALMTLPPYEEEVRYRMGHLYAVAGRPWEAVILLSAIYDRDPEGIRGQQAFYESLSVLVTPLKEYAWVEREAVKFLESHSAGIVPRQIAYVLTGAYQKQNKMAKIKDLRTYLERFELTTDRNILKYDCELWYMQAVADLMLLNYELALDGFDKILKDYVGFHQVDNSTYWHGMCQLFMQKYPVALEEFEAYPNKFPKGKWLPGSEFQCGICLFGLERYSEAKARFTNVIETWPDCDVYSDACSMRGDLWAAEDRPEDDSYQPLDMAQKDYEEAIRTANNVRRDTYPVFQMATMFDLEKRYDEILAVVNAYRDRRGDEADVAKASYWIGKTRLAQGLVDEAIDAYRSTILTYGGDILQDGVDLIIAELISVSRRLEPAKLQELKESLQAAIKDTDNGTLQLRLRVLLAKIDGTAIELGGQLISEVEDLSLAPPPVLAVISDASFEKKDYSRAEEILTLFKTRYEDSDFIRAAFKLRAFDLYSAEKLDEALKITDEAQAIYGTDPDVVWAQLLKGRIALQQGRFDAARKIFKATLSVRDWRGEPYAEATFYLGLVAEEEAENQLLLACSWFQRAYFQYKGIANGYWAAEGYLASARCLSKLGREEDRMNTYRAMLFDKYVNHLPQAEEAKTVLGAAQVIEINTKLEQGVRTNFSISVDAEVAKKEPDAAQVIEISTKLEQGVQTNLKVSVDAEVTE